jgi:tetratricopeptide (TPR) repeat protein
MGRVDLAIAAWEECIEYQRGEEDLARLGDLHRKVGSALAQKGEVKEAVARYQRGISLLKDGPPCREVVRLYEEAAALYTQSGENMLAIYSAEKALRLAERLGEARAASRAHEVFGRVFGRIGDFPKARENLEESVVLARASGPTDTIRALIALGSHLDMSEADYAGAASAYADAFAVAEHVGDVAAQVELYAALGMLAAHAADWDRMAGHVRGSLDAAAREGLVGRMAYPYALEGQLRWRAGDFDGAEERYGRALILTRRSGWSDVAFMALHGRAQVMRDRGNLSGALTALDQALDVCERAGLLGKSIEATAARAVTLVLAGKPEAARESADEAERLAGRLPYPVAEAASLEAGGIAAADPAAGIERLLAARDAWRALGRPLDAARCEFLSGTAFGDDGALERAAAAYSELGVAHMAERAVRR